MTRYALVLNKNAGRLRAEPTAVANLTQHLTRAGATLDQIEADTLAASIATAAETHPDALIVAGGDGTVACACQQLAGTGTPLAIIPLGTMNMLARDLHMPIDNLAAAADAIAQSTPHRIDVGRLGSHVFACACMLGAPARIGHHREIARARGNGPRAWLTVFSAAWRAWQRHRPMHLTLTVDGRATRIATRSLTITVNALTEGGHAFGRAQLDGGTLCAYVERARTLTDLLRLSAKLLAGRTTDPALRLFSGQSITVASHRAALRILIDGEEHLIPPPLTFTIWPQALTVLAPA